MHDLNDASNAHADADVVEAKPAFKPAWWANHAHAQTLLPVLLPFAAPNYRRERWDTPDGDFIDVDWVEPEVHASEPTVLVLFHGLEGSSQSSYAKALMRQAHHCGWVGVVVHWRSCSGEMNRNRVMYHSGFSDEIDWVLKRVAGLYPEARRTVAGVSLGGNALLKWLGEHGHDAAQYVQAAVAICAPHDLAAGAQALSSGFNQRVYMRAFLSTLKAKALHKLSQYPDLPVDAARIRAARDFNDFDECFTAPVHGFKSALDYWQRSSSKSFMKLIRIPTLLLNTRNDPIVPVDSLAQAHEVSEYVNRCYDTDGGHVGFVTARQAGDDMAHFSWMPEYVCAYLNVQNPICAQPPERCVNES